MRILALLPLLLFGAAPALAAPDCNYQPPPMSAQMRAAIESMKTTTPFGLVLHTRELTEKEPKNALAWSLRSYAEREVGDIGAALESINSAMALDPCDDDARLHRGILEERAGRLREAYMDYSALIDKKPHDAEAHEHRGDVLMNATEYAAAIADFDAALSYGKPNADLLLNRGGVMQELGRYREAIADYERILKFDPMNVDALAARGYSKFFLEDYAGAATDLQTASTTDDNALAWRFLAQSRAGVPEALSEFVKNAQGRPDWVRAVAAHFKEHKPDSDLPALTKNPELKCEAWFYLGEIALAQKDAARAKTMFLHASDECPIDPRATSGSLREYVGATEELKRMPR